MSLIRKCPICGIEDDHPRHVDDRSSGQPLPFHHDCHANAGCDVCAVLVAEASGKQGDDLRAHLESLPQRLWSHNTDGTATYENVEN